MTDFPNPEDLTGFDEIRRLMRELPGPDLEAASAVATREAQLTKPAGALGRLEEITQWLATWQGRKQPRINRPRIAVFAANHGVAAQGVSAYPSSVTRQMVDNFLQGGAAVNQLVGTIDGDLRVYELDLDNPTADFTVEAAMSEAACAQAMAYGMMAVEAGIDVLGLGEMGIGNTTSAAALCLGLFGGTAEEWVGPGTGVSGEALARKIAVVDKAYALHKDACGKDALKWLAAVGGLELAAIAGAVLAARLAKTPVLLDGFVSTAAAAVVYAIDPRALDHCLVAHVSAEPGHRRLIAKIGQEPLLDLGMRLGEGSGAAVAVSLLRAAATCHSGMATFGQAGVSGPV
ncbi:nicotinate-nucleotide--dimethylbenzimidazole phosphoribosyltransferase [Lacibacterium aquatile]|uniref:Nicotinate-nucleotide--dimethylbenzimidazole phosphoribosyltransferase n=1 Tax=Lacibacterium aquatile TaxID=1168082 RepID=A0ABW5DM92_9PROT